MDLFNLKNSLERGTPIAEIAHFLCRSEQEVREKIAELDAPKGAAACKRKRPGDGVDPGAPLLAVP
jgi:hypothetical protein